MNKPQAKYLKDYKAPDYRIESTDLTFMLVPDATMVTNIMHIVAKPETVSEAPLILYGTDLNLVSLKLDGVELSTADYVIDGEELKITKLPSDFMLQVVTKVNAAANTSLNGLYVSSGNFCTQCEPHGFRAITYFIDRPDNLSTFTTTIIGDKTDYPVLLSNGNLIDSGESDNGQHWAKWQDPFLKPSYLFALVAGKLDLLEDEFITMSDRKVTLHLYVDPGEVDKAKHAMESLKHAMRWDEEKYGREYDLDIFMIVAVRDFNMGAMENKGLNVFNSAYILANGETATDLDFELILRVVGHEYFHNWSGNRVTCRDWFQLSLKEGLTVFRDQTFTEDFTSPAIKRIDDVNLLRTHQFAEDSGPMAHPVLPKSYIEMNNFYTVTIYEKGAELIRMMHTLLGDELYRKATDLYFARNDGEAVTIEDFVKAMEDASGKDLRHFRRWYDQAGTPQVTVVSEYDAGKKTFSLNIQQYTPETPDKLEKLPLHIPIAVGLLNNNGAEILPTTVLEITEAEQTFTFDNIKEKPVLSLLRGFTAPIKLSYAYQDSDLALLLAHDTDTFARYEAAQQLAHRQLDKLVQAYQENKTLEVDKSYLLALLQVAQTKFSDKAFQGLLLSLPGEKLLLERAQQPDLDAMHAAYQFLRRSIAEYLQDDLLTLYKKNKISGAYENNQEANAKRRLKNTALGYLSLLDDGKLAIEQYQTANNMTDSMAALHAINHHNTSARDEAMANFKERWAAEPLVMDKWFALQASANSDKVLKRIAILQEDPLFNIKNPNSARSLIGSFAGNNLAQFHAANGNGYRFLAEQILRLDKINPQIAARMLMPFAPWRKLDDNRQKLIAEQLERIAETEGLSADSFEVVSKLRA